MLLLWVPFLQAGDVTVLMAVPTMYSYLLSHYEQHMSAQEQAAARAAVAGLRLTVSGSAAAPVPLLQRWQQLSGQMLLERYGMTETGMILSNPYKVCVYVCVSASVYVYVSTCSAVTEAAGRQCECQCNEWSQGCCYADQQHAQPATHSLGDT